jgi:hypothetical protein
VLKSIVLLINVLSQYSFVIVLQVTSYFQFLNDQESPNGADSDPEQVDSSSAPVVVTNISSRSPARQIIQGDRRQKYADNYQVHF